MSKPRGILRPLGLAVVLAIGFGAVFALAAAWGIAIWQGLRPESRRQREPGRPRGRHALHSTLCVRRLSAIRRTMRLDGSEVPRPQGGESLLWQAFICQCLAGTGPVSVGWRAPHRAILRRADAAQLLVFPP